MKLFLKKILLIIIGVVLSLVVLEYGLRFAGWTISSFQQYKNNKALRNKSQYTIMCLGESTTQGQYPIQLREILDKKYPNKFSVIDCGRGAARLESILNELDTNINKYHPNIAICMLGINNGLISKETQKDINVKYLKQKNSWKVINLLSLIKQHINNTVKSNAYANTNTNDLQEQLEFAIYLHNTQQFEKSINLINKILEQDPSNQRACSFQIMNYLSDNNTSNDILGYKLVLYALDNNHYDDYTYFSNGFNYCILHNKPIDELKQKLLKKEEFIVDEKIYDKVEPFLTDSEKQILLNRRNLVNEKNSNLIKAINYLHNNLSKKAAKYFDYRNKLLLKYPNIETYDLYKAIIKKLADNDIKVICMQYPIISVEPLKKELKNTDYYNCLSFISNEFNFKYKLKNTNYWDLFRDQFGRDFGHCTDLGNTMIAENVVKTLEDILNLKQN